MYCFFKTKNIYNSNDQEYSVVLVFSDDKNIEETSHTEFWSSQFGLKKLLGREIDYAISGFSKNTRVVVAMEHNFSICQVDYDKNFFYTESSDSDFRVLQKKIVSILKKSIVSTISSMQTELQTNEINITNFIKKIAKQTDKSEPWLFWEGLDEDRNKIEFYAPNYNTEVRTLAS
jgi:hypothetical protein